MANTGLLVLSNIKQFSTTLKSIEQVVSTLYIQLSVPSALKGNPLPTWGRLMSQLYADGHHQLGNNFDLRILLRPIREIAFSQPPDTLVTVKPVDTIFKDSNVETDLCERLRQELCLSEDNVILVEIPNENEDAKEIANEKANDRQTEIENDIQEHYSLTQSARLNKNVYDNVVLGGTFDRIHVGHKIFLSQAVLRTGKRLVVGVTTQEMTKTKTLSELILPVEKRIEDLREFLSDIDPCIQLDIVPISDPFGPTKNDPNMDMIVVSEETYRGGVKINEIRSSKSLKTLDIFTVEIIESSLNVGPKESKVSSSNTRIDLLGTRFSKPLARPDLPARPYIVGLTGGIASGKSRIAQRLRTKGAYIMDCDTIAHEIYEPGQICYERIIKVFGRLILAENGTIDRAKLGSIVFSNPKMLEKLNNIVWPELLLEVNKRIKALSPVPDILILEAAVLLKAGWEENCHEVWSIIVPPEEAVRRIMERNKLSNTDAWKRVSSQMTNLELVQKSNVVLSSQWEESFTDMQADKAWDMLLKELEIDAN